MNLKKLTDQTLLQGTEKIVGEEREILSKVLHYLREIHRRRLFSDLGFKSLHEFAVKHLKYSDDQAARRISAMRLINEIPEIEEKITSGELNISQIGVAQSFFNQEAKIENYFTKSEKLELLNKISTKSTREAQTLTKSYSSEAASSTPDRIKMITGKTVELRFEATTDLLEKIETLKGLLAHKNPNITLGELFNQICDLGIKEFSPATSPVLRVRKSATRAPRKLKNSVVKFVQGQKIIFPEITVNGDDSSLEKPIPKTQIRRNVFAKAHNRCQNCGSTYALEVDHIIPKAMGGQDTEDNLRILCRSCNQRAAIKIYGIKKMSPFLELKT